MDSRLLIITTIIIAILTVPQAIRSAIGLINLKRPTVLPKAVARRYAQPRFKVIELRLRRRKDPKRTWKIVKVGTRIISVLLLSLFASLVYFWIKGSVKIEVDIASISLIAMMTVPPIFLLANIFFTGRLLRRTNQSRVAKQADIEIEINFSSIFSQCQKVLCDMGATLNTVDMKGKLIEADLDDSVITIQIESKCDSCQILTIISDSKLPSVWVDFGKNRRNIDAFICRLTY